MAKGTPDEETIPLTQSIGEPESSEAARDSVSSASTTSLVFDRIHDHINSQKPGLQEQWKGYSDNDPTNSNPLKQESFDIEDGKYTGFKGVDKKYRRILLAVVVVALAGWLIALFGFLFGGAYKHDSAQPHAPVVTATRGGGKKVTLDSVLHGQWSALRHDLSWIKGRSGEDGMILERAEPGKKYLVVEDVRHRHDHNKAGEAITLMKNPAFQVGTSYVVPNRVWPSPDLKKVLVESAEQKNWRHSHTGLYWIFDVDSQTGEALDPQMPEGRIQLASWAPNSASVVFTRDNNMFVRDVNGQEVTQITEDGGEEFFNGVPDWVYEEEVFAGNSVTWWSDDSNYIAFLKTNESVVPTYPVQYFLSRPSGVEPEPGLENYPEVRQIKYPKAGAPNPIVTLEFYDVKKKEVFAINIEDDFVDDDRLITEIVWAGSTGKVIVRETNRESDVSKVLLMDVAERSGKIVRTDDVNKLDGGWFEISEDTTFIPSDPSNNRPHDGYIDTVVHNGYDHLAYFAPLDSKEPVLLTSGDWEVVNAPSAVDLNNNVVYFVATKESSVQRHIYQVGLDGKSIQPITDTSSEGWYNAKFSTGAGYVLLSYEGPGIPWQKIVSTSSYTGTYSEVIETNEGLAQDVSKHDMPIHVYSTINIDGFDLNVLERRPPYFNAKHKYPVLFYMYQGPGSQTVQKKFGVDFQSYIASTLGYIVVTVDGRGTGFLGRKTRCIVRGNIGYWESHDQIAAAKMWAAKKYVDAERMAIWGWSYGGFMTLKTLEQDGGETFKYGMAVAPVTDWRFYDSIYTERYMHTPQNNELGYQNASISDVERLSGNVRFLFMHGVADDNVHYQSSLTLMDKLDLAGIENYDMQVFPDSDHSIYFHNANRIVYDKLSNWLINAFNGEWLKIADPKPVLDWRRKLMYS